MIRNERLLAQKSISQIGKPVVKTKVKDPELIKKKQQQICRGAMRVFRTKGFHAASIREIAQASRISLGSLYDYIEKKEDILFLVHVQILDSIYHRLDESIARFDNPVDQLVSALRELFLVASQLKDEILFVYTETKSLEQEYLAQVLQRESDFVRAFEDLIRKGVNGSVFQCANADIFANIITFLGALIPLRGWNILPRHSEAEVFEEIIELVLKGLNAQAVQTHETKRLPTQAEKAAYRK